MTVLEFHPDDLIDRDARGLLSADEKRRLGEHLAQCAACRLELAVRADFDQELGARASGTSMQDFVSSALLAAAQPVADSEPAQPVQVRAPRVNKRMVLLLAACLVFVSGLAAAQTGLVTRVIELARVTIGVSESRPRESDERRAHKRKIKHAKRHEQPSTGVARVPEAAQAPTASALPLAASESPTVPGAEGLAPSESPALPGAEQAAPAAPELLPVEADTLRSGTEQRERHARVRRARTHTRRKAESTIAAPTTSEAPHGQPAPALPASAAGLFERAGAARREGRWVEASNLYRELAQRFQGSAEARLSLVLVARMQLDRGEPRAALSGFESYLATSDRALREEALAGRALAHRRLGQSANERDSVRALLAEYPDSPYGKRALERLERGAP